MPNFSICLIAKNEEKTLPRMIASLKEFQERGGEIWLLDTGSTDNTIEVAKELGCKVEAVGEKFITVIDEELCKKLNERFVVEDELPIVKVGERLFDYASARNYIADFALNDMIATPDCDEIYTKFDLDKIEKVIKNGAEQLEYNFVFSHDRFGNEAIKFRHSKFYNRKKQHWVGVVHEVLAGDAQRLFLDESIIKLEHFQNETTNRGGYLRGLALDCYLNPDNDRNSHYLARELLWSNRPKSAISEFKRHIAMNRWPAERSQSMIFVGDCYGRLNQPETQMEWYNKAIYIDPLRREAYLRIAAFYKFNNNLPATAAYASAALQIPWSDYFANDRAHYENYPHELLYWALGWMGDIKGARFHITKALEYQPQNEMYLRDRKFYFDDRKISFVMPVLNLLKMTEETVKSLIENTEHLGEIILIDDHSTEDFTKLEGVEYHLNTGKGVTDAWNYGASLAKYPYICWINNDLLFTKGWDKPLLDNLNDDVWVTSPYHTAFEIPADFPAGTGRHNNMEAATTGIKFLGSCFVMEKKNWERVGPIDPRMKIWCGDNYIYESIVRDFGRTVKEVPESYIHHLISKTVKPDFDNPDGKMLSTTTQDMKEFETIFIERKWSREIKYPEISKILDLRLRLPITKLPYMRVLNVGVGDGGSGLARQLPFLKFGHLDNIDVYQPYLDEAIKKHWEAGYISFENKDILDIDNFDDYDLVMMFDILEHLTKEEAVAVLNKIKKSVVIFGPEEKEFRPNPDGVLSQDHKSFWTEQDFKDLGFETELLVNFHGNFNAIWGYKKYDR